MASFELEYIHGYIGTSDLQFSCDLDNNIDSDLYDWRLSEMDFLPLRKAVEEWRDFTPVSLN